MDNNLREKVLQQVRAEIISGQSGPGTMYSVPTLATCLGISTTPVREALLELSRGGLVEPMRNRGFKVVEPTLTRRRFADAQRNAWSRVRFHIGAYRDDYRKAGKAGRKDMLKGAASALISSKAERERLERKQKNERLYFADKLRRQAERLKRPIDEQHKKEVAKLVRRHDDEHHKMRMAQSKESQAQARDIKEGRDRELFNKEQRGKLREELKTNKRDLTQSNVPPPSRIWACSSR
jgi:DNA-binding transcriptional regulator YhcF (GntR family)